MSHFSFKLSLPIIAVFVLLMACVSQAPLDMTPEASPVLFQDDFSDIKTGWDQAEGPEGISDYNAGRYRIEVKVPNADVWSNPDPKFVFGDVRVEVDAFREAGSENNSYGIICRYKDPGNFYFLIISSDGYFGIGKVRDGQHQLINRTGMLPSEAIHRGGELNHIQAECRGTVLALYVNDQLLDMQQDADLSQGQVGLLSGTFDEPGVVIEFDNFKVMRP